MFAKKLGASAAIALSLSLGTVSTICVSSPAAYAADPTDQGAGLDTIDLNHADGFNLHLTKYLGAPTGQANDGTKLATAPTLPLLQGVVFDIYEVQGINLSTNDGWTAATALQGHTITQAEISAGQITVNGTTYKLNKVSSAATNAQGQIDYKASAPQLVLVNENLAASGTITNVSTGKEVAKGSVTASTPFLTTLPMTDPSGDQWNYDVYAYPKNSSDTASKSVVDKGTVTLESGSLLTADAKHIAEFTVTGTITPGLTGEQMGTYQLTDTLDARLGFIKTVSVKAGSTPLVAGTDYTETVSGQKINITMTPAGLTKLAAAQKADPAAKVSWVFDADLKTEGDGILKNTAYVIPNQGWADQHPGEPGTPTNETVEKYGDLSILKQDGADKTKLAGAQFALYQIWTTSMDPKANGAACQAALTKHKPIMSSITTAADGTVLVKGLQQSDWYDGAAAADVVKADGTAGTDGQVDYLTYCLVETKAPEGYNVQATPIPFTITQEQAKGAISLVVNNEKRNLTNQLPLTGGSGAAALGVGGMILLGGTAALVIAKRRRDANEAA